jgi:phosphoglycerol transferase MdoB-like AlkP superfamily enzyme
LELKIANSFAVTRTRYGALVYAVAAILITSALTRLALLFQNYGELEGARWLLIFALPAGLIFDLVVAAWAFFPFGVFLLLMRDRWLASKGWYYGSLVVFFFLEFFLLYIGVVEYYFFGEYNARFNAVAVDYLVFPHEVLTNIWVSYPVIPAVLGVGAVVMAWTLSTRKPVKRSLRSATPIKTRLIWFTAQVAVMIIGTSVVTPRYARISDNRIVNEITMNGIYAFADAMITNHLEWDRYYARIDEHAAVGRLRTLLTSPEVSFLQPADSLSIDRKITPAAGAPRPLNVVLILEESFGAQYVHSLNPNGPQLTPEFEKLAADGLLFTNSYATGNRTVRGMEATLLGLPPIPGQSIIRQESGHNVFSLPALLKSLGYQTLFLYGGYSYYDNMKDFALNNGIERVIDINDPEFATRTYSTLWGVCDEDLFNSSIPVFDSLQKQGRPFFSLMLTVSNHSPFGYPAGRIPEDPAMGLRDNAVKYADFALGKFFRDIKSHPFFDSTLFVILGDHGPRVFGPAEIPMNSYQIPILFYGPHVVPNGVRDGILGSQLDVPPTIMGILNVPYHSQFFGDDLLKLAPEKGRAFLSLNRDVAMVRNNRMAVLGIHQTKELWLRDSTTGEFTSLDLTEDPDLVNDVIAYFQTASEFVDRRQLRPLQQPNAADAPVSIR